MARIKIYTSFIILFGLTILINAQPPIPEPNGRWVIDDANIISEQTKTTITSLVQQHFDSTSNQIVVYTFNSLEGSALRPT